MFLGKIYNKNANSVWNIELDSIYMQTLDGEWINNFIATNFSIKIQPRKYI